MTELPLSHGDGSISRDFGRLLFAVAHLLLSVPAESVGIILTTWRPAKLHRYGDYILASGAYDEGREHGADHPAAPEGCALRLGAKHATWELQIECRSKISL